MLFSGQTGFNAPDTTELPPIQEAAARWEKRSRTQSRNVFLQPAPAQGPSLTRTPILLFTMVDAPSRPSRKGKERETFAADFTDRMVALQRRNHQP